MTKILSFCIVVFSTSLVHAQTCQSQNYTPSPFAETLVDTTSHAVGNHTFVGSIAASCAYTGSDATGNYGPCNVSATVTPTASESDWGVVTGSTHVTAQNTASMQGSANGGGTASATGGVVGAVKACFFGLCGLSVSVNLNPVSFNYGGADVWTHGQTRTMTCLARAGVAPPPPPPPPPPEDCSQNSENALICQSQGGIWNSTTCKCRNTSPIIISLSGDGYHLTDAANGVRFDMEGNGNQIQLAWTASTSKNAFLALDRNGNGTIDDGKDLFGNFTDQPSSPTPNGFLALAEFDKRENGGNGDGIIDAHDTVFRKLRLWIDASHDGVSQSNELFPLPSLGVYSLGLRYRLSRRVDQYGNEFRYTSTVNPVGKRDQLDRRDYDVFLVTESTTQQSLSNAPLLTDKLIF